VFDLLFAHYRGIVPHPRSASLLNSIISHLPFYHEPLICFHSPALSGYILWVDSLDNLPRLSQGILDLQELEGIRQFHNPCLLLVDEKPKLFRLLCNFVLISANDVHVVHIPAIPFASSDDFHIVANAGREEDSDLLRNLISDVYSLIH